jgi:hypothetical protein
MKTKWFISTSLILALFATVVKGFTIDGTASPGEYPAGQPLAVQVLGSNASAQDPTNGNVGVSSGSQLDAAYGVISNGTLYLLIGGNLQSDLSADFSAKLSIFISTGAPGQNTLANNGALLSGPDFGAIPRMSAGGDPNNCPTCPGLTFDTGFNATYWINVTYGGTTNPTMYVNYFDLTTPNGGNAYFLGNVQPGTNNVVLGSENPFGIQAAMNNSNIGGVDTNLCTVNTNGAAQSIAAAAVKTGVELAISLNALGGPTIVGPVQVTAFLSTNDYSQIYDQILSPGTPTGCVDDFAYGDPLTNNFSTLPGTHSFTVPISGCNYTINPFNALFNNTSGAGSFTVGILGSGGCSWVATSSVPWVVITSAPGVSPVTYTVAANAGAPVRTGTISVTGLNPTGVDNYTVTQSGVALSKDFVVDGTAESAYGCPIAVQNLGTGFGNSINGAATAAIGGSELDAAYGMVENNVLFLTLSGNLENNGNKLMVFFMTTPGGQQTLTNVNPGVNGNILVNMGVHTNNPAGFPGLTFDPGFKPNYWVEANGTGSTNAYSFFLDYAQLWPGGTNASGIATNGYFVGYNHGTNGVMLLDTGGRNPFNIQATINNSNTNGVDGGTGGGIGCYTNALTGDLESVDAAQVRTGVELAIPLAALGNPTGTVAVCAFIDSGDGTYMANQFLGSLGSNDTTYCQANLGTVTNTAAINLGNFPGQHYFMVGPEVHFTSIAAVSPNIVVSYVPEANSNLTYQLQRTATISNGIANATWVNVGGLQIGTNTTITQTVTPSQGSTNRPTQFYRVRQTPLCD